MMTKEQFYKSKKWEDFRSVIIQQRMDPDGYVHCCGCGKPILKKYDLILHHKQELTDANVGNALVALNPDNVECICFKCHNKEHEPNKDLSLLFIEKIIKKCYNKIKRSDFLLCQKN